MKLFERTIIFLMPVLVLISLMAYFTNSNATMHDLLNRLANTQFSGDSWFNGMYWIKMAEHSMRSIGNPDISELSTAWTILSTPVYLIQMVGYSLFALVFFIRDVFAYMVVIFDVILLL